MVGSTKDPADGPAVAGSIFTAVIVYAVRPPQSIILQLRSYLPTQKPQKQHR